MKNIVLGNSFHGAKKAGVVAQQCFQETESYFKVAFICRVVELYLI